MNPILLVTYGGGHVAMMIPLARELLARGVGVQIIALTTAEHAVRQAGLPCISMRDFLRQEDVQARHWGEQMAIAVDQSGVVPRDESIAYLGLSYADLVDEVGEAEAAGRYAEQGRQAFRPVRLMRRILSELRPSVVVATNSPRAERAAIEAAGQLGIPSVCMIDLFALQEISWIGQPGFGNRLCVISESVRQRLLDAGRQPAEVLVTGNPSFDRLATVDVPARRSAERRRRGWGTADTVVLWVSHVEPARHPFSGQVGDPDLPRRVDRALVDILSRRAQWRLVIRPHPSENPYYAALPPRVSVSARDEDLTDLLATVDCVLVCSSTVGLEAALLGLPVVQLRQSVFSPDAPYAEMGLAVGVDEIDEIEMGIECALLGPRDMSTVLPGLGEAAARIADVVQSLVD